MSWALSVVLMVFLISTALAAVLLKDLLAAVIVFSAYSLMMALLWSQLRAPDLALTEAAVGAGVTTVLFIITLYRTVRKEDR